MTQVYGKPLIYPSKKADNLTYFLPRIASWGLPLRQDADDR
ncbi:MAG TPA: hypothetical protein V6D02_11420 [Candidatus Obscuribacterales bacterium]